MKTISRYLLVCVVMIPPGLASGEEAAQEASSAAEKSYHFFVGANLRIPYEETYFPVERIWNARAHIKVNDGIVAQKVSSINDIKVDRRAKVSPYFAQITDLKCEPIYSVGRDPRTLAARQQMTAQSLASDFSDQADSAIRDSADPGTFLRAPTSGLNTEITGNADTKLEADQAAAMDFGDASNMGDINANNNRPMWDMLHIQFSISADQYFPSGHLVFIFQLADRPEGEPVMSWFHFLSLKDISSEAKSYNYRLAAYPDGMYIASRDAFLYANGTEIATNLSSKLVAMKKKEARVFIKYQYLAENSGKTRPPERAWKYLDPPLRDNVTMEIRDKTITLKIDAEGQVQDLRTSPAVQTALTPEGLHEIASLMYLPALDNGKPVPGELTLTLKDVILD